MKKFTLFAGMALVALGASAQFTMEDGSVKAFAEKYGKGTYYSIGLSEYSVEQLQKAGNTVVEIGPNNADRNAWVWDATFEGGATSIPAPGWDGEENMDFEYASYTVTSVGWSGVGYNIADGSDVAAKFTDDTRFHLCYATTATAPAAVGLKLLAETALFGLGNFPDNGPSVAPAPTEDWQTLDISFGDISKSVGGWAYPQTIAGNYMVVLAGGVTGTNISLDNAFFFTPGDTAIEGVEADDANAPVEYFNLQGVKVANPEGGLFIKVQGNKATKVVL